MASRPAFNALKLSLGITVPLLIDLAYQEGYVVPSTIPNFYTKDRLKELSKPTGVPFSIPPSLTFTRYRTENPFHVQYVHAKKSFWRYNVMWSFVGIVSTTFQLVHMTNSLGLRRPAGAVAAAGAIGLTWAAIIVEGNARKMYLEEMHNKVMEEEEKAFKS
jgi:hypothetical protein